MLRKLFVVMTSVALFVAPAAADSSGPLAGYDPALQTFFDVKSPPLVDSDWFSTAWGMHVTFAFTNYAGFLFDLQYDGHELSQIVVSPAAPHVGIEVPDVPGLHPTWEFPGSQTSPQTVVPIAAWIDPALARQSGMTVNASSLVPLFDLNFHAKNTTPANNSDIDITVSAWQILHLVQDGTFHISESMWVYKTEGGDQWVQEPGAGRWFHPPGSTTTFIPASAFVATNNWIQNVAGFGIEHVPEPAALGLLLAGVATFILARRRAS